MKSENEILTSQTTAPTFAMLALPMGLSSVEATARLQHYGANALPEKSLINLILFNSGLTFLVVKFTIS